MRACSSYSVCRLDAMYLAGYCARVWCGGVLVLREVAAAGKACWEEREATIEFTPFVDPKVILSPAPTPRHLLRLLLQPLSTKNAHTQYPFLPSSLFLSAFPPSFPFPPFLLSSLPPSPLPSSCVSDPSRRRGVGDSLSSRAIVGERAWEPCRRREGGGVWHRCTGRGETEEEGKGGGRCSNIMEAVMGECARVMADNAGQRST